MTPAPSGAEWFEADVKFCLSPTVKGSILVRTIRDEFRVEVAGGPPIEPNSDAPFPDEVFSSLDGALKAKECARGPVVFAIPPGIHPSFFLLSTPLGILRWRLA